MRLVIESASPEFERALLALIEKHSSELKAGVDVDWTVYLAVRFLGDLSAGARELVCRVLEGGGAVDAEVLRAEWGSLKGPGVAITKAVNRGVRQGLWPAGMPVPVEAQYGAGSSWRQAREYRMPADLVPVFQQARAELTSASAGRPDGQPSPRRKHEVLP